MTTPAIEAFTNELRRYRMIAEKAIAQLDERSINQVPAVDTNSIAMLLRHLSGNLTSRFKNFLLEDGEKSWRNRDAEFAERSYTKAELDGMWRDAWLIVDTELSKLVPEDLERPVAIRGVTLSVADALARSVAHVAYHVGQIVLLARILTEDGKWEWISIPKGQSETYNAQPTKEKLPQ